ncbi:hypothetical protein AN478_12335 [Thiohalorhabdus denitrificans]|uniref:Uncharacterized protein n=1 Tax=Thiohalorhabdus denitrificans TaxID=381306 RepID=A0A0P9CQX0_9GAMM|nr:DsrE family protein [Thiohalorhabdus denitrificans]KPV39088.1 hypothetical protein AN478_12335 [Thiohalorhabdus denitrificans]SCX77960.1 hypothetical protein SAMN05661077_0389 [Thiohalorhabdus denitrificans]
MLRILALALLLPFLAAGPAQAQESENAPWGHAESEDVEYSGQKVVMDVTVDSVERMNAVLDRASYISELNGANPFDTSIVLVLHGEEIPFFAIENYDEYEDLMTRAHSLTMGDVIEFRMCKEAAAAMDYGPEDIHGFVTLVPMAEAEIIRLQEEGHAYLQY